MSEPFTANPVGLGHLLSCIEAGKLALPDFQRDYVWHPSQVAELLCSIEREFPAGSILIIKSGKAGFFAERTFEGAPVIPGVRADELVLDGQQRLTSLYGALYGTHPTHRFYVRVRDLLEGRGFEEALTFVAVAQSKECQTIPFQKENWLFPLARLFVADGFLSWAAEVAPQDLAKLFTAANVFARLKQYRFPVVTLNDDTSPEAVCRIFTAINSSGTRLTVFDLLAARLWISKVRLRDLLSEAFENDPVLEDYLGGDPVPLLQTVALLAGGPATQSALLALTAQEVEAHWATAVKGLSAVVELLRDECGVLRPKYLPYGPALVAMGSAWPRIATSKGPEQGRRRDLLKRWFWCTSFAGRYDASANTRMVQDARELAVWLDGGPEPLVVAAFDFRPEELLQTSRSTAGLYRAVLALMLQRGAVDFHKSSRLTVDAIASLGVDDHHVFPKNSEIGKAAPPQLINSILNRVLIDPTTNKRISNRPPSDYLTEIATNWNAPGSLETVLQSHLLPSGSDEPLRKDDFARFLEWRQERIAVEVQRLTGWARESQASAQKRLAQLAHAFQEASLVPKEDTNLSYGYEGFSVKLQRGAHLWFGTWSRAREWSASDRLWLQWNTRGQPSEVLLAAWAALRKTIAEGVEFSHEGTRVIPLRVESVDSLMTAINLFLVANAA